MSKNPKPDPKPDPEFEELIEILEARDPNHKIDPYLTEDIGYCPLCQTNDKDCSRCSHYRAIRDANLIQMDQTPPGTLIRLREASGFPKMIPADQESPLEKVGDNWVLRDYRLPQGAIVMLIEDLKFDPSSTDFRKWRRTRGTRILWNERVWDVDASIGAFELVQ